MVLLDFEPPVARLTLNRVHRHNSLVPDLLRQILTGLDKVSKEADLRAAVLLAKGPSFSTGGDLEGFADHLDSLPLYAEEIVGLLHQTMLAMQALPMPIVTAVQGRVTGGSLGLVLAADLVLVSPEASFTPYYREVGFSPDGGWTAWLPAIIGPTRASAVLLNNLTITAEQAVAWGMANRLVPHQNLESEAAATALQLSKGHSGSLKRIKTLLTPDGLAEALEREKKNFVTQIDTPETRASMLAFLSSMKA
jgi:2-(1,2-epoxy-1,2-dihydrophenyl)acetyl-CoA isomerase